MRKPYGFSPSPLTGEGWGECVIDTARFIHESVGCAMRTDGLKGAHGAPYGAELIA